MSSKELLIKVGEGKIQSKCVIPGKILYCKFSTEKNCWKTKPLPSCENPDWNESKSLFFGCSKSLKIELFQGTDLMTDFPIAQNTISIPDLLKVRKTTLALYSLKTQIASLTIEATHKISPKNSPMSHSQEGFSFRILTEREKIRKNSGEDWGLNEDQLELNANKISDYLEKINYEFNKVNHEKIQLKEIKQSIKIKEACLAEERKDVEKQKREIAEEIKAIQALRIQLSKDYAELKCEKFRHKAKKILLSSRQRKLMGISSQIIRQRRLVNKKSPEFSINTLSAHSLLGLSESVRPIIADSDSPTDGSPINTLESL